MRFNKNVFHEGSPEIKDLNLARTRVVLTESVQSIRYFKNS